MDVVTLFGTHIEKVGETLGGDEPGGGALAFEDGVAAEGRAGDDRPDVLASGRREGQQLQDTRDHSAGWVGRLRESLVVPDRPGVKIGQDEVREGATDIDTDGVTRSAHAGSSIVVGSLWS